MKVLLVNSRYFVRGGPERYLFNLRDMLEARGHEVIPFSTRHPRNETTTYDRHFVDGIGGDAETFADTRRTPRSVLKMAARTFYSVEVKKALSGLIDETEPDLAMLINYKKKLSPAVIDACADAHVPIIVRLTDFTSLCPQGTFLRQGHLCELCVQRGTKLYSVRHRCVKGSLAASWVNYLADRLHELRGIEDRVDLFVTPSEFARRKFLEGGLAPERITLLPQFIDIPPHITSAEPEDYVLYFGRVADDKGLDRLIRAFARLKSRQPASSIRLRIVGPDLDGERGRLIRLVSVLGVEGVTFEGPLERQELGDVVRRSRFTVVPSKWYDLIPNSVLESFMWFRPVVASDLGSFREVVQDGETGMLCDTSNTEEFSRVLDGLLSDPERCTSMGRTAHRWVLEHASPQRHYERFMELAARIGVTGVASQARIG